MYFYTLRFSTWSDEKKRARNTNQWRMHYVVWLKRFEKKIWQKYFKINILSNYVFIFSKKWVPHSWGRHITVLVQHIFYIRINATLDVAKFKSISLVCNSVVLVDQKKLIPPIFYNNFLLYLLKIWALKNESHLSALVHFPSVI
jgi:hypothetical protein